MCLSRTVGRWRPSHYAFRRCRQEAMRPMSLSSRVSINRSSILSSVLRHASFWIAGAAENSAHFVDDSHLDDLLTRASEIFLGDLSDETDEELEGILAPLVE